MRLGDGLLVSLRRLAGAQPRPADTQAARRRQLERDLDELARRHARRQLSTEAYLLEHGRLGRLLDEAEATPNQGALVDPDAAVRWLGDMQQLWRTMDEGGRRDLAAALYERITVTSAGIASVKLTPEAMRHGAALAPPETVALARPEGNGHPSTTIRIKVEGRAGWLRLARSA